MTSQDSHFTYLLLRKYVLGEESSQVNEVEKHLASCRECRDRIHFIRLATGQRQPATTAAH